MNPGSTPQSPLVLVVEDDEEIREGVAYLLGAEGYAVEEAPDGAAALRRLQDPTRPVPACVVLDLMMPVMDGWELLQRLEAEPVWSRLCVVVLTANQERPLPRAPVIKGVLSKPFLVDSLLREVRGCAGPGFAERR